MRVKLINPRTKSITSVDESRLAEYEAKGYTLASDVIVDIVKEDSCATVKKATKRSKKTTKE